MKPQVIFLHILKTGGSSLRYMLQEEYGNALIAPVPVGKATNRLGYPTVKGINPLIYQATITPEMVKDYSVVMSHYDWRITERLPEWQVITMFRHPVEQLYSTFRFMKWNHDLQIIHQDMQYMTFFEWMENGTAQSHLNTQTRYLSAHGAESIDEALDNLQNERLHFGVMEYFEESIRRWNKRFGWTMKPRHDNKTPRNRDLSDDEVKLAEHLQRDDMRLYNRAKQMFVERI